MMTDSDMRQMAADFMALVEQECRKLVGSAESLQAKCEFSGDLATALILQQQSVGCKTLQDAVRRQLACALDAPQKKPKPKQKSAAQAAGKAASDARYKAKVRARKKAAKAAATAVKPALVEPDYVESIPATLE